MTGQTTWSELVSQPDAWEDLLARIDADRDVPAIDLSSFDEVLLVGSGTSYYLAMAAADWMRRRHALPVRAVPSCEVMLDADERVVASGRRRLVVAVSRSGESSELVRAVEAMRAGGAFALGVSCVAGSTLLRIADRPLLISEGREDGLVMLRSFTAMLIALQYLTGTSADRDALRSLPAIGRLLLDEQGDALGALARRRSFDRFVFLGSGPSYPLAHEAGLKIQEMSCSTSEAYHSLEYRHGPKATADADTLLVLFALADVALGRALARDMTALGVTLLVVGPGAEAYRDIAHLVVSIPAGLDEGQAAAATLLPLQLVAFETAMRRNKDPDAPDNLSRVVILEPVRG